MIIPRPLPAFCYSNKELVNPNGIVIHYFSCINVAPERWDDPDACYDLFIDLNSDGDERGLVMKPSREERSYASAHYMIDRNGHIYQLVPDDKVAYHAGKSSWNGRTGLNWWTFGIEFIAHKSSGYTDQQYAAGQLLCAQLMTKYNIHIDNIVGHEDVAPGRKVDPGELFDWSRFKESLNAVG